MPNKRLACVTLFSLLALAATSGASPQKASSSNLPDAATLRGWVEEMKASPKGPFQLIRWFCADGTVHPAKPYPCENRGGGIQHGLWTDRVAKMRADGYAIANLFAEIEPQDFVGSDPDLDSLNQILLERFLVEADDGWIFRRAYGYRGAFQIEDEEAGARRLIDAMVADPAWHTPARFALVREAVRLLPLQTDAVTATKVRQLAIDIADADPGFAKLRAKIHGAPDAGDAAAVRAHAAARGKPELAAQYAEIAANIDALYAASGAVDALQELAERSSDSGLSDVLRKGAQDLAANASPEGRLTTAGTPRARSLRRGQHPPGRPRGSESTPTIALDQPLG
jgi:hypothetical protein